MYSLYSSAHTLHELYMVIVSRTSPDVKRPAVEILPNLLDFLLSLFGGAKMRPSPLCKRSQECRARNHACRCFGAVRAARMVPPSCGARQARRADPRSAPTSSIDNALRIDDRGTVGPTIGRPYGLCILRCRGSNIIYSKTNLVGRVLCPPAGRGQNAPCTSYGKRRIKPFRRAGLAYPSAFH